MEVKIDGKKVRLLMIERNIGTVADVAIRAGLSPNTVSHVMRGAGWSSKTLASLALALNCDPLSILKVETCTGHQPPAAA